MIPIFGYDISGAELGKSFLWNNIFQWGDSFAIVCRVALTLRNNTNWMYKYIFICYLFLYVCCVFEFGKLYTMRRSGVTKRIAFLWHHARPTCFDSKSILLIGYFYFMSDKIGRYTLYTDFQSTPIW